MSQDIFGFDETKETKDFVTLTTPGIHRNLTWIEGEIKTIESKEGKSFTMTSLKFQTPEGIEYEASYFRPPATVEECTAYSRDVWKDGKKTDEKKMVTQAEVFKEQNQAYLYHLAQLGQAVSGLTWEQVLLKLKPFSTSYEALTNGFIATFKPGDANNKNVDIKLLWANSEKTKKSYLGLAKASEFTRAFATYVEGKPSSLSITEREHKNGMVCRYPYMASDTSETSTQSGTTIDQEIAHLENASTIEPGMW